MTAETVTGLVGYLYAAYDTLLTWLGPPDADVGDEDKTNAEWTLVTPDGGTVYVYDYGDVGWGAADDARERDARARWTTEWHVGACDEKTAQTLFGDTLVTAGALFRDALATQRSAGPQRRHRWTGPRTHDQCQKCGVTRRWQRFTRRPCQPLAVTRPAGLDDASRAAGGGAGR